MPVHYDLLRKFSGSKFFTKIDLDEAYNQIKLAPESQRCLALSSPRGVFLQTSSLRHKLSPRIFRENYGQID